MNKVVVIPEDTLLQLLEVLNEVKSIYQNQIVGTKRINSDNHLSEKQAAAFLNCSISKIQVFRKAGSIEYFKFGRRILYKERSLKYFIDANSFDASRNLAFVNRSKSQSYAS